MIYIEWEIVLNKHFGFSYSVAELYLKFSGTGIFFKADNENIQGQMLNCTIKSFKYCSYLRVNLNKQCRNEPSQYFTTSITCEIWALPRLVNKNTFDHLNPCPHKLKLAADGVFGQTAE